MDLTASFATLDFSFGATATIVLLAVGLSAFIKIATVLGILRAGLGMYSLPSAFVTGALAIALAFAAMYPTLERVGARIDQSASQGKSDLGKNQTERQLRAIDGALAVWKDFLQKHSGKSEIEQFQKIVSRQEKTENSDAKNVAEAQSTNSPVLSLAVLAPAFIVTELKEAFATGLTLFLPFLIVELLTAHILLSIGFSQLSPAFVSLPFKLLLFVMVDGWLLITQNLLITYG